MTPGPPTSLAALRRAAPAAGRRLRDLIGAPLDIAIACADGRGRIEDMNAAAELLFGVRREEMRGRPLGALCPLGAAALLEAASGGAGAGPVELPVRRPDGTTVHARHWVAPMGAGGAPRGGHVLMAIDVSADRARDRRVEAVRRVAVAVASGAGLREVCALAAREARAASGADAAGVARMEDGAVVPVADAVPDGAAAAIATALDANGPPPAAGDGIVFLPPPAGLLLAPVAGPSAPWGTLWVAAERDATVARRTLRQLADLIGHAVPDAGRGGRRDPASTLADLLSGRGPAADSLEWLVGAARDALGAARVSCWISVDGGDVSDVVTTERDPEVVARLRRGVGRRRSEFPLWNTLVAPHPSPVVEVPDVAAEPRVPAAVARGLGMRAAVLLRLEHPLVADRAVPVHLGLMAIVFDRPRALTPRERAVAESLGALAALTLAGDRLEGAQALAAARSGAAEGRDRLTGLLGHNSFQDHLSQSVARARRSGGHRTLALIDIDRFRRVNERHGHEAGDRVLRAVARQIVRAASPGDIVGRVGGEELAWLMERPADEALQAVEGVREAVARERLEGVDAVTISAGLCGMDRAGGRDELVRLAEGALYWAKQHGRNMALVYAPDVVEALSADERAEHLAHTQALQSIRVLARAVDAKDPSTLRHSERVADLAVAIATALGWDSESLVRLREAGLVHDVGKIGVPDSILFKPARLTREEYRQITRHAAIGAEILADVLSAEQVAWVRGHHERWDGAGYPDGLAGDDIPAGARVLALADAWDVMTSERPYHRPLSVGDALAECDRCAGAQFAPEAVAALRRLVGAGALRPREAGEAAVTPPAATP